MPLTRPAPTCSASSSTSPGSRRSTSACVSGGLAGADGLLGRRRRAERRHVGDRGRVGAPDPRPVPARHGLRRRDDRAAPARRRPCRGGALPRPTSTPSSCMAVETARGTPGLDILREQLDSALGLLPSVPNLPDVDTAWWDATSRGCEPSRSGFGTDGSRDTGSHHPVRRREVDDQDDHWADRPAVRHASAAPPPWDDVERMLSEAQLYWIVTVTATDVPVRCRSSACGTRARSPSAPVPTNRSAATSRPTRRWR